MSIEAKGPDARPQQPGPRVWLIFFRRYLLVSAGGHTLWELLHFSHDFTGGSQSQSGLFLVSCILTDIAFALSALMVALVVVGDEFWPKRSYGIVALVVISLGILGTIAGEWLNVAVFRTWALIDVGLSPVAQWLAIRPRLAGPCRLHRERALTGSRLVRRRRTEGKFRIGHYTSDFPLFTHHGEPLSRL